MTQQLMITQDQPGAAAMAMIQRSTLADSTKAQYRKALGNYLDTGHSLTDAEALADYALTLNQSSRSFLKAAVRLWAESLERTVKGQATPDNVSAIQAALYRLDALNGAIQVKQANGTKTHTWLSKSQVKQLLNTCQDDITGQRDRLLLGLLVAAGLRRKEAATLRFEDVQLIPRGDRFRTVLAIEGKGAKSRTVPISDALANAIDAWAGVVGGQGRILRSLGMARRVGDSLSPVAIFNVVRKRGAMIGKPQLAPHDLRRTYAQIGFEEGIPITQLSVLLGHASVETTRRYLDLNLDLDITASDFVPF